MLQGLDRDLARALAALDVEHDTPEDRQRIVDDITHELITISRAIGVLLDDPAARPMSYRGQFDHVARTLLELMRFVGSRSPSKALEARLNSGVAELDRVLEKLGAPPIESRKAAELSQRALQTSKAQDRAVTMASAAVATSLDAIKARQIQAIMDFYHDALLKDREQPRVIEAFLKALVTAASIELSEVLLASVLVNAAVTQGHNLAHAAADANAAGHAAQAATLGHAAHHAAEKVEHREMFIKLLTATTESGIEAGHEGGESKDTEGEEREGGGALKVDRKALALNHFSSRLIRKTEDRFARYRYALVSMVVGSEVSDVDLHQMGAALDLTAKQAHGQCFVGTTKAWTTYLAHSRLGTHYAGNKKVSNMRDYFGKQEGHGRAFGTDRSGGDGVLAIVLDVEGAGHRPQIDRESTRVLGVNSLLSETILGDAHGQLARVGLPKEVTVRARFAQATIALDETNRIRDVRNWDEVARYLDETPQRFWNHWGDTLKVKLP